MTADLSLLSVTNEMVHWQSILPTCLPFFRFESGMSVMNDVVHFDSRVIVYLPFLYQLIHKFSDELQ